MLIFYPFVFPLVHKLIKVLIFVDIQQFPDNTYRFPSIQYIARRIMFKRIQSHLKSWRISPCGNKTEAIDVK